MTEDAMVGWHHGLNGHGFGPSGCGAASPSQSGRPWGSKVGLWSLLKLMFKESVML